MSRFFALSLLLSLLHCTPKSIPQSESRPPSYMVGDFTDDYGIKYSVSHSHWIQHPNYSYEIVEWHINEKYCLAKNTEQNPHDPGKFSRIDWMELEQMEPFQWAFCITAYNAPSISSARTTAPPDRHHPKTGCNGFPFSRMKPL